MKSIVRNNALPTLLVVSGVIFSVLTGCIKNDIPFPRIPQYILSISAKGETSPAVINESDFTVTLTLGEDANIREVSFTDFTYSPEATPSVDLLDGTFNLSTPLVETLTLYQPYQWVITANQDIERYFRVEGQFGESEIDVPGRRVIVKMPETADLEKAVLIEAKLGPKGHTVCRPSLKPGIINLSLPLQVEVITWNVSEMWTIYTLKESLPVQTVSADAWSKVVWVYGSGNTDNNNSFEYKRDGDSEWTRIPDEWLNTDGGSFSAGIRHLEPLTDYVVRSVCDAGPGNEIVIRTEATEDLPDGDMEQWSQSGKTWNPWNVDGEKFWDTGNKGSAIAGMNVTEPSDYSVIPGGKSAKLETVKAAIFGIGKLASGSLYTGDFIKIDGTNGVLAFGRPWTTRPTALKGYYQYDAKEINEARAPYEHLKGRPDSCQIYIALTDWPEQFEIRTNPSNRQLFNPDDPHIIAYGHITVSTHMTEYAPLEIPLVYRSTSRVPRFIQITAASSKYGDFFTGGIGSCLYIDQLSLDYDLP